MSYPARGPAHCAGIDGKANAADRRHAGVKICDDLTEAAA
jgi:hypothetical protein